MRNRYVLRTARLGERGFDALSRYWEAFRTRRSLGTLLVASYLGALAGIQANRMGLLPGALSGLVPRNHFGAVDLAFSLLLAAEVLSLVFVLAESVANSVGKQFELLSLILLREAFLQFAQFGEPIVWAHISDALLHMLADAVSALLVFVVLGLYYRVQRHMPITEGEHEQSSFVMAKKGVALVLLAIFTFLAVYDLARSLSGRPFHFFEAFYLVLIFSDILIVLISFRYTSSFRVLFRNSGFAVATVVIRLALTAPPYFNAVLGVGAALLALSVSLAYNTFAPVMRERAQAVAGGSQLVEPPESGTRRPAG